MVHHKQSCRGWPPDKTAGNELALAQATLRLPCDFCDVVAAASLCLDECRAQQVVFICLSMQGPLLPPAGGPAQAGSARRIFVQNISHL